MATLVAGAPAFRDDLWHLLAIVVVTTLVFWAAHIYAHGLAESLQLGRRITGSELAQIAHRERAMGLSVVLPAAALVIGALGVIERFRRDLAGARARRRGACGPGSALRAVGAPEYDRHRSRGRAESRPRAEPRHPEGDRRPLINADGRSRNLRLCPADRRTRRRGDRPRRRQSRVPLASGRPWDHLRRRSGRFRARRRRVFAGPSAEDVVPHAAVEAVPARAAAQVVRPRAAEQAVVDLRGRVLLEAAADQEVGAVAALEAIRPVAAEERVASRPPDQPILPVASEQLVVARQTGDDVSLRRSCSARRAPRCRGCGSPASAAGSWTGTDIR